MDPLFNYKIAYRLRYINASNLKREAYGSITVERLKKVGNIKEWEKSTDLVVKEDADPNNRSETIHHYFNTYTSALLYLLPSVFEFRGKKLNDNNEKLNWTNHLNVFRAFRVHFFKVIYKKSLPSYDMSAWISACKIEAKSPRARLLSANPKGKEKRKTVKIGDAIVNMTAVNWFNHSQLFINDLTPEMRKELAKELLAF